MKKRVLQRSLAPQIEKDLGKKMVLVAGPRQCGKTTLAKSLTQSYDYLNYDSFDDRAEILKKNWDRRKTLIILDELHKMPRWKSWLKGIYDTEGNSPSLLVTGSARMNAFRKTGDSLAGRHFYFRLHPLDLKEIFSTNLRITEKEAFDRLMTVGGYPEPFLNADPREYRRWRQSHLDTIVKQDLRDLESVHDIKSVEILIQLLRTRVGSGVSINALATDLQKDHKTIQRWLEILEDLFVIFRLTPYSKNIERAVKKEPKFYFYDTGFVQGDAGQKLENLVACALLKESHYLLDVLGRSYTLHYLKIKGGREIDFAMVPEEKSDRPIMIEVKNSDAEPSNNFKLFEGALRNSLKVQLVQEIKREFTTSTGIEVRKASSWLSDFTIPTT